MTDTRTRPATPQGVAVWAPGFGAGAHPGRAREALKGFDFRHPVKLSTLFEFCDAVLPRGALNARDPRHLGLLDAGLHPAAEAMVTRYAGLDPQLAVWGAAPYPVELEQHALFALAKALGYTPPGLHAQFTSGGSESNLLATALALAAHEPGWCERGLAGARPTVYASEEAHATLDRAAMLSGLGRRGLVRVRCDAGWRVNVTALRRQIYEDIARGRSPAMIVGTAGATSSGAIDTLSKLAALCASLRGEGHRVWFHVDAAWGALAGLSPRTAGALAGIAEADSITWCAHKTLGAPVGTAMFFSRHRALVREVFRADASYMPGVGSDDRVQPFREGLQWSRRAIGLPVFAVLAAEGLDGLAARVDTLTARARFLAAQLAARGWSVVNDTPLPLVCVTHPRIRRGQVAPGHVALTLRQQDVAWVSETRLAGRLPVLRLCVLHPEISESTLLRVVDAMCAAVDP